MHHKRVLVVRVVMSECGEHDVESEVAHRQAIVEPQRVDEASRDAVKVVAAGAQSLRVDEWVEQTVELIDDVVVVVGNSIGGGGGVEAACVGLYVVDENSDRRDVANA